MGLNAVTKPNQPLPTIVPKNRNAGNPRNSNSNNANLAIASYSGQSVFDNNTGSKLNPVILGATTGPTIKTTGTYQSGIGPDGAGSGKVQRNLKDIRALIGAGTGFQTDRYGNAVADDMNNEFGNMSRKDMISINDKLQELTPSERSYVVSQLSDKQLQHWAGQTDKAIGGLGEDRHRQLFNVLGEGLDGTQATRIYKNFTKGYQRQFLGEAMLNKASPAQRQDFIRVVTEQGLDKKDRVLADQIDRMKNPLSMVCLPEPVGPETQLVPGTVKNDAYNTLKSADLFHEKFLRADRVLNSKFEDNLVKHWICGSGATYNLTPTELAFIGQNSAIRNVSTQLSQSGNSNANEFKVHIAVNNKDVTAKRVMLDNGQTGYAVAVPFYGSVPEGGVTNQLDGSFGTATAFFDRQGKFVGLADSYDFDSDAIIRQVGKTAGAKNFLIQGGVIASGQVKLEPGP